MEGRIEQVGFPDFWQKAHEVRPQAFKAISELMRLQQKLFLQPLSEPLHKVIRHIAKITINSMGALTTLLMNGYGNDGMKIARSMYEAAVTVRYLRNNPTRLANYLDYQYVLVKRQLDYLDSNYPDLAKNLPPDRRLEIEQDFARVKMRFTDRKGKLRGSWNNQNISQMATAVGLGDQYPTFYGWASSIQHIDIRGLTSQAEGNDVDVAPSLEWIDIALVTGHQAALIVLDVFNEVAGLGFDAEIKEAGEAFKAAW